MPSVLPRRSSALRGPSPGLLLLALVSPLLLGLGASPRPTDEPLDDVERKLMRIFGDAVKVSASTADIDRKRLLDAALKPGSRRFQRFGDGDDDTMEITVGPARRSPPGWPRGDARPTMVQIPNASISWLVRVRDALVMPVQVDLSHSVSVRYDPPETRIFAGPDPKPVEMGVEVYDLQGSGSPEHTGSLEVELIDRGVRRLKTPAGGFDVVMFRSSYRGRIGPANIDDHALLFVSPDHGIVAAVEHKDVSAMIFYEQDTRRAQVLAASGGQGS